MQKKELGKQKKKRIGNLQETFAKDEDQKDYGNVHDTIYGVKNGVFALSASQTPLAYNEHVVVKGQRRSNAWR